MELDDTYSRAYAALASTYWDMHLNRWGWVVPIEGWLARERSETYLEQAMRDPTPLAHRVAAAMRAFERRHDEAVAAAERALAIDPNGAESLIAMAVALNWAGRAAEARPFVERAMRLDPHYPAYYTFVLGLASFAMDRSGPSRFSKEHSNGTRTSLKHCCRSRPPTPIWAASKRRLRHTRNTRSSGTLASAFAIT